MADFEIGDLVVLTAGSMRMAVEGVEPDRVHVVWVHEGRVGRDSFSPVLLKKWEVREPDARGGRDEGPRRQHGGDDGDGPRRGQKPFAKPFAKPFGGPAGSGKPRPPKVTGWDGKPRERKFFRKD